MRIIAGQLGGRNFSSPHGNHTHPMSDKVRGALFNTLGDIDGLDVLDAFAGTGALAFEAISRGAKYALLLENDASAQRTISENVKSLSLSRQVKLVKAAAGAWLDTTEQQFNIVMLDPPYDHIQPLLLADLANRTSTDGVVVLSLPPDSRYELNDNFKPLVHKNYGDAELAFYRRIK